jgi:hypothetical protein
MYRVFHILGLVQTGVGPLLSGRKKKERKREMKGIKSRGTIKV